MSNSSMSRGKQGEAASANTGNNPSWNANGEFSGNAGTDVPGSQQNTTGWKLGDPICPFDRDSYTKRVAERINFDLNAIEKSIKVKIWTEDEKKKVSAGVAGIACNTHENYCLYEKVIEYAIGEPLGRICNNNNTSE
jgi:hypothetical protein